MQHHNLRSSPQLFFFGFIIQEAGLSAEVGLIENEPISKRRLILCPALLVLIFFAIENLCQHRGSVSDNGVNQDLAEISVTL